MSLKYYMATAVNSLGKPIAFISNTDYGVALPTRDGRYGDFCRSGALALGDMIKESAFQKMQYVVGLANQQKGLADGPKMEFIRKMMFTNLVGEISSKYSQISEQVYRGIFTDSERELFSDADITQCMVASSDNKSVPEPQPSEIVFGTI